MLPRNGFLITIGVAIFVFNHEKLAYMASVALTKKVWKKKKKKLKKKISRKNYVMKFNKNIMKM